MALSNYFLPHQWEEIRAISLSPRARVLILTNAGMRLRQLGRLIEARDCFLTVLNEISPWTDQAQDMEDASYAAAQICELLIIAGKLVRDPDKPGNESGTALFSAMRAVEYSSRGQEPYFNMHAHTTLAEVYFMLGDLQKAGELFELAMSIDKDRDPRPPFLYSQILFRYGYFLVETNRAEEILNSADQDPSWGTNGEDSSLLSRAIRLLIMGAARRALIETGAQDPALMAAAEKHLNQSIDAFRDAGYADYLVRGLIERARFYQISRDMRNLGKSLADLDEATAEASRGQMELLYTDVLLQRMACYLDAWPTMTTLERSSISKKVSNGLREATALVNTSNYGRRQKMLAGLKKAAAEVDAVE